jgi:hypothetical protein
MKKVNWNFWVAVFIVALIIQELLGFGWIGDAFVSLFLVSLVYWPWKGFVWLCRQNHPDWFPKYEKGPDGKRYTLLDPNWENEPRPGVKLQRRLRTLLEGS